MPRRYHEIYVLFDRYKKNSIKAGTRERRTKTIPPIRHVIENRSVPLPSSWPNFLALPERADLVRFLSEHLITNAPPDKVIVVAGDLTMEKKHNAQTRKWIQPCSMQQMKKQTQELFITVSPALVTPWLYQRDIPMYFCFSWHMQQIFVAQIYG
jgi:hypothetical protein